MTIDNAEGAINAAPIPWSILAIIRTSIVGAIPARTEDKVRTTKPIMKILFEPKISESLLPRSNKVPKLIT